MGKSKGGGGNPGPSKYETALANIANDLYSSTSGLRSSAISTLQGVANGDYNVFKLPTFQPLYAEARSGIENQYQQARNNLVSSVPRGGVLDSAMRDLESNRANQVGSLTSQLAAPIIQGLWNNAYGAGFQTPSTAIQGLSAASNSYANRYAASMAADAQSNSGFMQGLGMLGMGFGKLLTSPTAGTAWGSMLSLLGG